MVKWVGLHFVAGLRILRGYCQTEIANQAAEEQQVVALSPYYPEGQWVLV